MSATVFLWLTRQFTRRKPIPRSAKANGGDEAIMWLNLVSDQMTTLELTDYTNRYLADRFLWSMVARMRVSAAVKAYAMRIWLDRRLASRSLTVADEAALRAENVELPAGSD